MVFDRARMFAGFPVKLECVPKVATEHGNSESAHPETDYFKHLFEFSCGKGLGAGYYKLVVPNPKGGTLRSSAILIDSGLGFNRKELFLLTPRQSADAITFDNILIPRPAQKVRLEITSADEGLPLESARLRRMMRTEFYLRLALRAFGRQRRANRTSFQTLGRIVGVLRTRGIKGLAIELRRAGQIGDAPAYDDWISAQHVSAEHDLASLQDRLLSLVQKPKISVVMPVYNTPERLLVEAIDSVRNQVYDNWELCIADDGSSFPGVRQIIEEQAQQDERIKIILCGQNGGIAKATSAAFGLATGEWVALLDHDDVLDTSALAEVALHLQGRPNDEIIYSDEDKLDLEGNRFEPYFKPDFSREFFRSQNYFNHLTLHKAENIRAVGGWREGFEGSQDYDLNLRIIERIDPQNIGHIPKILYHWRAVRGSTAHANSAKSYAHASGLRALEDHVQRIGLDATIEPQSDTNHYRVRLAIAEPAPLVSLIIATKDMAGLLRVCIDSIREKTTYPNYEIVVVDNNSIEQETHDYLNQLRTEEGVQVLRYSEPFNFSAMNNFAVRHARGSVVALVNNDIEVITPDWLTEMVSWALQPDVGCVGAKLYYPDDTIQHAGVIIGLGGVAGHSHKHFPREQSGYFSRLKDIQNLSAVTGACLVVRKEVYERAGGLNETDLKIAFNDVDFCLRVREMGLLNVWTPYAELYHHESMSRGPEDNPEKIERFRREIEYMRDRWDLRRDPYYSRHLTLDREDFSLAIPPAGRLAGRVGKDD